MWDFGSEELALLVAEFALLDEQLALLAAAVAAAPDAGPARDDALEKLAVDIPDMRIRAGIPCAPVPSSLSVSCP